MATTLLADHFASGTIDTTTNWSITDPSTLFSVAGGQLNLTYGTHSNRTIDTTFLKSQASADSGVIATQAYFDYSTENGNPTIYTFELWADNNNRVRIQSRGTSMGNYRLQVIAGGVTTYDTDPGADPLIASPKDLKITYDVSSKAIKFWYWSGSAWTQMGTTQTQNIGTSAKAYISIADNVAFTNTNIAKYDDIYLTEGGDYTSHYPDSFGETSVGGFVYMSV